MSADTETFPQQILPATLDALQGLSSELSDARGFELGLMGGTALILAAGLAADRISGKYRWPTTEPTFKIIPPEHGADPRTVIFVGGGFNSCADGAVGTLIPELAQYGTTVYARDADSGYHPDRSAQAYARVCSELGAHSAVLVGLSMKGAEHVPTAAYLKGEKGLRVFSLPLGSPMAPEDIRGQGRLNMLKILAAGDQLHMHGGLASRILLEMIGYTLDNHMELKEIRTALTHSIRKARQPDAPSNIECMTRARHMLAFDLSRYLPALADSLFGYFGPTDPEQDLVVRTDRSIERLNRGLTTPVFTASHSEVGHANPSEHAAAYRSGIRTVFTKSFGIQPAKTRRATISMCSSLPQTA